MTLSRSVVLGVVLSAACVGVVVSAGGCSGGPGALELDGGADGGDDAAQADGGDGGAALCSLPADPGPCAAAFEAFFFDAASGRCERFTYGGCEGNANRFGSAAECIAACAPAHQNPCAIVRCPADHECVYLGEAPTCARPCDVDDAGDCGGRCDCGSSCPGCDDCVHVCVPR